MLTPEELYSARLEAKLRKVREFADEILRDPGKGISRNTVARRLRWILDGVVSNDASKPEAPAPRYRAQMFDGQWYVRDNNYEPAITAGPYVTRDVAEQRAAQLNKAVQP